MTACVVFCNRFCQLVQEREASVPSQLELAYRFQELDPAMIGHVSVGDYVQDSLKEVLRQSSSNASEMFSSLDEGQEGDISAKEFRRAVRTLGFQMTSAELNGVLATLSVLCKPGHVPYLEIQRILCNYVAQPDNLGRGFDATHAKGNAEVVDQLREQLSFNRARIIDVFLTWDEDNSGSIDSKEFWLALRSLGMEVPRHAANELFDQFDADGSGEIDFRELNAQLRKSADIDESLQAGAKGEITLKSKNKTAIRKMSASKAKDKARTLAGFVVDSSMSVTDQLIAAIHKSKARLLSLFVEWDENGDGQISKGEMLRALRHLGLTNGDQDREVIDELFTRLDKDNSVCLPPSSRR